MESQYDRMGGNQLKMTNYVMIFLLLVTGAGGCCALGKNMDFHQFDAKSLNGLVLNQTTAAEVCQNFGAANQVVKMSNGNAYIYRRAVARATAVWLLFVSLMNYDKQYDQIVFFFDNNDILTHYGASLNAEDASYGFPF